MKRTRLATVLAIALLMFSFGRASALQLTPPAGVTTGIVACPALANNVGVNGVFTITDQKCIQTLLSAGWGIVGASHSWLSGSSNAVVSNTVANFIPIGSVDAAQPAATEGDITTPAATVGTLSKLSCELTTAAGVVTVAGGTSYVVAVRKNLATTASTCTIAAAASSCVDNVDQVTTAVGDQLDYIDTPNGTPTALVVKCSVQLTS